MPESAIAIQRLSEKKYMFEDLPTPKSENFPRNLENLSVKELEEYILELESEIVRARDDIKKKNASQDAANSFFK